MNSNNDNNPKSVWDLEFEGLLRHDGCVDLPISIHQWENNVLALDVNTKQVILKPTLQKIWDSLRGNLTTRLKAWIRMHKILPTPTVVIEETKKMNCVKNYKFLLQTSPFIIKKIANKINNTLDKEEPLCSQRMEYYHFTHRQDVLQCLQQNYKETMHKQTSENMQRSTNYNRTATQNNPMIANSEIGCISGIGSIAVGDNNSNISNHLTVNISHFGHTISLLNEPVGSFSLSPDAESSKTTGTKRCRNH
jgi:hypothetical protein